MIDLRDGASADAYELLGGSCSEFVRESLATRTQLRDGSTGDRQEH
jgi:hypothetical protein